MRRKVIQMAGKTHVVSLPSAWVKRFGVKKGDELDVTEYGNKIIVNSGEQVVGKTASFDISDMNVGLVWRHMLFYYKSGHDEVKVRYLNRHIKDKSGANVSVRELMSQINSEMIGFEIVSEGKNHFVFREISLPSSEEFENLLRRVHYSIKNLNDGLMECVEARSYSELKMLQANAELNVNKMTNLLARMLGKGMIVENGMVYVVLHLIEDVGDAYKDVVKAFIEKKEGIRKEVVDFIRKTNKLYDLYLGYFNKKDRDAVIGFEKERAALLNELDNYSPRNNEEIRIIGQLKRIIYNLIELVTLQLE